MRSTPGPPLDPCQAVGGDRILFIDEAPGDHPAESTTGQLIRLLTEQACSVSLVKDRAVALEALGSEECLFILLRMRGADGLAILRRLRERRPAARAVIVTTDPSLESAVEALRLGAFDYLQEPVPPSAVEALVGRARLLGDPRQRAWLRALQDMAPGLVHEFRNPLSGILASGQMLSRLPKGDGRALEYVEIIRDEAQQLGRFLARLAEFGRLAGEVAIRAGEIDLHALLGRILEETRPACQPRGIRLATRFDPRAARAWGDPAWLARACSEILCNAVEAMPDGGTLTVTTRDARRGTSELVNLLIGQSGRTGHERQEETDTLTDGPIDHSTKRPAGGGWVEVEFADTGTGMTDEVRRRALEPFFSTRPRSLGIGLSLAQAILLDHGGTIRLGPPTGRGMRVFLTLPAGRATTKTNDP